MTSRIAGTLFTSFGMQLLGIVSGILLARILGVEGRGQLASAILWPSLLVYLGDLGGPTAYVFYCSQNRSNIGLVKRNLLPIAALQSIILIVIGIVLIDHLTQSTKEVRFTEILFLMAFVPLNLCTRYANAINQGTNNFRSFNNARIGVQIAYVIGVICLALTSNASVSTVLTITILSNVAALLVAWHGIYKIPGALWRPDINFMKSTINYGIRAHLGNLTPVDSLRLDVALVSLVLGANAVGIYAVALSTVSPIRSIGSSYGIIAFPAISSESNFERKGQVASGYIRQCTLITSALTCGVILISPWAIPLVYGADFDSSAPIAQLLAIGMFAASQRQLVSDCLRGANAPIAGTAAEAVGWIALLLGIPAVVLWPGILPIVLAVCFSYFASYAVTLIWGRKLLSLTVTDTVPRLVDAKNLLLEIKRFHS